MVVGDEKFRTVQTGLEAHPASYTIGTGSFPRVKQPARETFHSPTSNAGVENCLELCRHLSSLPAYACHWVTFTITLPVTQPTQFVHVCTNTMWRDTYRISAAPGLVMVSPWATFPLFITDWLSSPRLKRCIWKRYCSGRRPCGLCRSVHCVVLRGHLFIDLHPLQRIV